jgi:TetR/AcrR family transcriptional regulator, transcriptional repressor of aconitase
MARIEIEEKPRNRHESRAATRSKLVESARYVFAQEGYEKASIEKMVQHAGFSKGAFYANFHSKDEMFTEILQEYVHGQSAALKELLGDLNTAEEIIAAISKWVSKRGKDREGHRIVVELIRHAALDKELSTKFESILLHSWRELGELLYRIFQSPDDAPTRPEALGALVMELTYGQALMFVNVDPGELVSVALSAMVQATYRRK